MASGFLPGTHRFDVTKLSTMISEQAPILNYELVRDRIAEILAIELANQAYISDLPIYDDLKVYVERIVPCNLGEKFINVAIAELSFDNQDVKRQDGTHIYSIDFYVSRSANDEHGGDTLAMLDLQRLMGTVYYILMHTQYYTLGFGANSIGNRRFVNGQFAERSAERDDTAMLVKGRMNLSVRVPELNGLTTPIPIGGQNTKVFLAETEFGLEYIYEA